MSRAADGAPVRPVAPTLASDRLILRHVQPRDFDYFAAAHGDMSVMHHLGGPILPEDAWRRALSGAGLWSVSGFGLWIVERRSDSRPIGHMGFFDFHRAMEPSIAGEPEMGWIFLPEAQGQGLAHEACVAALAWADATLGVTSYPAIISPDNGPSIRLAERLGFVRLADTRYRDAPIALFRLARA